jgi:hypothetical protein
MTIYEPMDCKMGYCEQEDKNRLPYAYTVSDICGDGKDTFTYTDSSYFTQPSLSCHVKCHAEPPSQLVPESTSTRLIPVK